MHAHTLGLTVIVLGGNLYRSDGYEPDGVHQGLPDKYQPRPGDVIWYGWGACDPDAKIQDRVHLKNGGHLKYQVLG